MSNDETKKIEDNYCVCAACIAAFIVDILLHIVAFFIACLCSTFQIELFFGCLYSDNIVMDFYFLSYCYTNNNNNNKKIRNLHVGSCKQNHCVEKFRNFVFHFFFSLKEDVKGKGYIDRK